jgi:hypothetical protein
MKSTTAFCAMTLAAAGLLVMPIGQAWAQTPSAPSTDSAPTTAPADIPDTKLDAAATAAKNVTSLKSTYEQKLAQAPVAEKQRIANEADNAMVKAVTDQGLSIDEFKTIMNLAQNDPAVRNKLMQRLK